LIIGLAVVWMASAPSAAWGQWTTGSGGIIYYSGGNVGIGTTSPAGTFDVNGPIYQSVGTTADSIHSASRRVIKSVGQLTLGNDASGESAFAGMKTQVFAGEGSEAANQADIEFFTWGNSYAGSREVMRIRSSGNVGIGTTNPQYLLSVKGTVGAEEVIVTNTGWSDYVFQPGYRLRPLTEVGAYIQANHHLPDIPSEAEVKEKGVSVGEMQSKLLAKVEELTLHIIKADERNNRLEQQNQDLRERLARLENGAASGATPTAAK
jgi:hypothetical protein